MKRYYENPQRLTRAPWWPSVAPLSLEEVVGRVRGLDPTAADVLVNDMMGVFGLSDRSSEARIEALLRKQTASAWVARWQPSPELVSHGLILELRDALMAVDAAFDTPSQAPLAAPPEGPDAHELAPIAGVEIRLLAERARRFGGAPALSSVSP
ncbi:MAG: hypothetical protein U1F43_17780, partial [Myxococcota bacterium]